MINELSREKTADAIKRARRSMGRKYTLTYMGELLKLTRQSYAKFEKGDVSPHLDYIYDMCKIFDCDIGYLFGEYPMKKREISDVHELTGLSEKAIERLIELKEYSKKQETQNEPYLTENTRILETINLLLGQEDDDARVKNGVLSNIAGYLFANFGHKDKKETVDFGTSLIFVTDEETGKIQPFTGEMLINIYLEELQKSVIRLRDHLKNPNKKAIRTYRIRYLTR